MSTVNLAEAIIVVDYRHPTAATALQTLLANSPIEFVAPDDPARLYRRPSA